MKRYRFLNIEFTWDERKALLNSRKHGVRFEEAATVFADPLARICRDPDHSETEDRCLLVGHSLAGRMLLVVHTVKAIQFASSVPAERTPQTEGLRSRCVISTS